MSIKINYTQKKVTKFAKPSFFANDKFNINSLRKYLSNLEFSYINDLLKTSDLKKNLHVLN